VSVASFGAALPWRQLSPSRDEQERAIGRIAKYVDIAQRRSYPITIDQPVRVLNVVESQGFQFGQVENWNDVGSPMTTSAFVASMIESPRCTVITGNAGSGKSAVLFNLAHQLVVTRQKSGDGLVPLPIQLSSWQPTGRSLSSWIAHRASRQMGLSSSIVWHWLKKGDAVILMDGFDEVMPALSPIV
jgi:predicted NACHT family NTPase